MVDRQVAQALQPVVDRPVERHDVDLRLEQLNERQEAVPVKPIFVQPLGRPVRGRDHHYAPNEQPFEQAPQDHRVGDVDDMELIEAENTLLRRDLRGQSLQGLLARAVPAQAMQAPLYLEHEGVEVHPSQCHAGGGLGEEVHKHRLASAYPAVEVDAARRCRSLRLACEAEPGEQTAAVRRRCGRRRKLAREPVETRGSGLLHRIRAQVALLDQRAIGGEQHSGPAIAAAARFSGCGRGRSTRAQAAAWCRAEICASSAPVATSNAPSTCRPEIAPPKARAISMT